MPENPPVPSNAASTPPSSPSSSGGSSRGSSPATAAVTVFRLAALFTFLAVAMGSVVCATGSGAACPTWPGCHPGQITPQWELSPLIEFTHRVVAILTGPLVLAAAVMSARLRGGDRWVRILPWVALAGALAAGVFGRLVVVGHLPTWLGAVDLFSALTAMTVMTVAAVRVWRPVPGPGVPGPDVPGPDVPGPDVPGPGVPGPGVPGPDVPGPGSVPALDHVSGGAPLVTRLAGASVAVLVAIHVSGIFAAGQGSFTRCVGWPIWRLVDGDVRPALQGLRLGLAALGAALVVATAVVTVRSDRFRKLGVTVAALFAAEMVLGGVIASQGLGSGVAATYSVLAVALLWCLGVLAALAGSTGEAGDVAPAPRGRELAEPASAHGSRSGASSQAGTDRGV